MFLSGNLKPCKIGGLGLQGCSVSLHFLPQDCCFCFSSATLIVFLLEPMDKGCEAMLKHEMNCNQLFVSFGSVSIKAKLCAQF